MPSYLAELIHASFLSRGIKFPWRSKVSFPASIPSSQVETLRQTLPVLALVPTKNNDEEKKLLGFASISQDCTDQKRASRLVQESEYAYRMLKETLQHPIVDLSPEGHILSLNQAAESLFGWSRHELLGKNFVETFVPYEKQSLMASCLKCVLEEKPVRALEISTFSRLGDELICSWNMDCLTKENGTPMSIMAVGLNVTERKQYSKEQKRLTVMLSRITGNLERVREEEQKRIAHDLHDELGHSLTSAKLDVSQLRDLLNSTSERSPSTLLTVVDRIQKSLDRTLASVRMISRQVRPDILHRLGMIPALEELVAELQERSGLLVSLSFDLADKKFDCGELLNTTLYRIVQEALTNVIRHAHATRVDVRFVLTAEGQFVIEIEDNGIGFDQGNYLPDQSLGVRGMLERVNIFNGHLSILGKKGEGTVVKIQGSTQLSGR